MDGIYDDHGIRFEYPVDWELDVTDDGPRTTASVQSPGGLAFALVTVDEDRPAAAEMADEAPRRPARTIPDPRRLPRPGDDRRPQGGRPRRRVHQPGHDQLLRHPGFRTPRRTVFLLAQWSDLEGDDAEATLMALRRSIEETDA